MKLPRYGPPGRSGQACSDDDGQIRKNALVLTLSAPDQVIEDFDTDESPFMAAMVREIESSAQSIQQIFEDTRAALAARTENRQLPTVSSTLREAATLESPPTGAPYQRRRRRKSLPRVRVFCWLL